MDLRKWSADRWVIAGAAGLVLVAAVLALKPDHTPSSSSYPRLALTQAPITTPTLASVPQQATTTTTSATRPSGPRAEARAWITSAGPDAARVQADFTSIRTRAAKANAQVLKGLGSSAQQLHDLLKAFTTNLSRMAPVSNSKKLSSAEEDVLLAANDLKNDMAALATFARSPTPANRAKLPTTDLALRTEWNLGVRTIWRIAAKPNPPTI